MKTQKQQILEYMQIMGEITPLDALQDIGCMRLSARIYDLRRDGHKIKMEMASSVNRDGQVVNFARYRLEEE